jgi:hypothetical protein
MVRELQMMEAEALLQRLCTGDPKGHADARTLMASAGGKTLSLAEIYRFTRR